MSTGCPCPYMVTFYDAYTDPPSESTSSSIFHHSHLVYCILKTFTFSLTRYVHLFCLPLITLSGMLGDGVYGRRVHTEPHRREVSCGREGGGDRGVLRAAGTGGAALEKHHPQGHKGKVLPLALTGSSCSILNGCHCNESNSNPSLPNAIFSESHFPSPC